jgi:hypothetical protein
MTLVHEAAMFAPERSQAYWFILDSRWRNHGSNPGTNVADPHQPLVVGDLSRAILRYSFAETCWDSYCSGR